MAAAAKKQDQLIDILKQLQERKTVKPEDATRALAQYFKVQDHIKALKKEIELFKVNHVQQSSRNEVNDSASKTTNGKGGTRDRSRSPNKQPNVANVKPIISDSKLQNGQRRASIPVPSIGYKQTTSDKQSDSHTQITTPKSDNASKANNNDQKNGMLSRRTSLAQPSQSSNNKTKQSENIQKPNGIEPKAGTLSRRTSVVQGTPRSNNTTATPRGASEGDSLQAKVSQLTKDISERDQELAKLRVQNAQLKASMEKGSSAQDAGPSAADTKGSVVSVDRISSFPPPQKLVTDFKHIYENEWKLAFQDLQKHYKLTEETITELLGAVAKEAYNFCQNAAKQQYDDMTKSHAHVIDVLIQPRYVTLSNNKDVMTPKSRAILDKDDHLATRKYMKQYRRAMARVPVPGLTEILEGVVQKDVLSRHSNLRTTPKSVRPYIHRLLEVNWLMAVSEPPLVQVWQRGGQLLSRDTFAAFDNKGATVIHTVWPALLMYKDGPLADRGVCRVK